MTIIPEDPHRLPEAAYSVSRQYFVGKRIMDVIISLSMLSIFLPLFVMIAAAIFIESPGPVIFRQKRIGLNGIPFLFLKFRSMQPNAEEQISQVAYLNEAKGLNFKIWNDPRMTKMGRFLRRYSLDELPQLWNVLKGDISLIGPRPQLPCEVSEYLPWHAQRLRIQPGIACLREVSGRSLLSFDRWVELDLEYICRRSLLLDFCILLRVVPAILFHQGAC